MDNLHKKYSKLKEYIASLENLGVAFSGGVDSTLLLKVASDVLGDKVVALTAKSVSFPDREYKEATAFTRSNDIRHIVIESKELEIQGFAENTPDRCYICKKELFGKMKEVAFENGIIEIAEGSNMDDLGDYRPGLKAIEELNVKSPLRHAKLNKEEIRRLSRILGLPTAEKPSFACLASRFPYGEKITAQKLKMVGEAEQVLINLGLNQVRVRYHETLAKIEVPEEDFEKIISKEKRDIICSRFKEIGFTYVAIDFQGYRTGSMNETLNKKI